MVSSVKPINSPLVELGEGNDETILLRDQDLPGTNSRLPYSGGFPPKRMPLLSTMLTWLSIGDNLGVYSGSVSCTPVKGFTAMKGSA